MAYSDEQKYSLVISAIKKKFHSTETWPNLLAMLKAITRAKVKTFIMNAIDENMEKDDEQIAAVENSKADKDTLKTELDQEL